MNAGPDLRLNQSLVVKIVNLNSLPGLNLGNIFPIGLVHLKTCLERAGCEVEVVDFSQHPEQWESLDFLNSPVDILGFSLRTLDSMELNGKSLLPVYRQAMTRMTATAKRNNPRVRIVLGGPAFTLFPRALKQNLPYDHGISGYGETPFLRYLVSHTGAERGTKHPTRENLTDSVEPGAADYSRVSSLVKHYAETGNGQIGVQTLRGQCPLNCIYCAYGALEKTPLSFRPIPVIREEILNLYHLGVRRIFFTDFVFNLSDKHVEQICAMLLALNKPDLNWAAFFLPRLNERLLERVKASGCEKMILSLDSFSDCMLKNIGKPFNSAQIDDFLQSARRAGVPIGASVLFGGPGEDEASIRETCAFANANFENGELFYGFGLRVQPGSALALAAGLGEQALLYPKYLHFGEEIFKSVLDSLEPRFTDLVKLNRLISWKQGYNCMRKIPSRNPELDLMERSDEP